MSARVLVVDDEPGIRDALADALTEHGLSVCLAEDGRGALEALAREPADIVLADVRMPRLGGLDLLRQIRARVPAVDVVMMTAFDDMPTVATAMREGAVEFLTQPLDLHELRRVLDKVLADRRVRIRADAGAAVQTAVAREPDRLVGRDPQMIAIYKVIGQVAATRTRTIGNIRALSRLTERRAFLAYRRGAKTSGGGEMFAAATVS